MRRGALGAALLFCLAARPVYASGHVVAPSTGEFYGFGFLAVLAVIAPSEFGALLPAQSPSKGAAFDLGWSWQVPLPIAGDDLASRHHRVVAGLDYFPVGADSHLDARFGYRYDRARLFAGLATGLANGDFVWSPELGVKLVKFADDKADFNPSLHLLVRANVAPAVDALQGVTVLLGWNVL